MKENQSRRVLAGSAILLVISALAVGIFLVDPLRRAFAEHYGLVAVFPSAPRLRVGSPVWVGGHEVGQVVSIGFRPILPDSSPSVAVRVEIQRKHQQLVRRNSAVRLTTARTIGEPVIDIAPGDPSAPALDEGDTLFAPAVAAGGLKGSVRRLHTELDSLLISTKRLQPVFTRGSEQFARVSRRLDRVQTEFASLRLQMTGGSLDLFLNDATLTAAFDRMGNTAAQLGTAFRQTATQYRDPAMRAAFTGLQQRADALSAQLTQLREQFANGSLPRFARDSAIFRTIHAVQVEIDSLVAMTRRDPLRFWRGDSRR